MKLSAADSIRRRRKDLLVLRLGKDLVIIDTRRNEARILNPAAAVIWKSLSSPRTLETVIHRLEKQFSAPKQKLATDTRRFIKNYLNIGILQKC